jgi:hypothetical protein
MTDIDRGDLAKPPRYPPTKEAVAKQPWCKKADSSIWGKAGCPESRRVVSLSVACNPGRGEKKCGCGASLLLCPEDHSMRNEVRRSSAGDAGEDRSIVSGSRAKIAQRRVTGNADKILFVTASGLFRGDDKTHSDLAVEENVDDGEVITAFVKCS